jgi:hypothetical protein
LGPSRSSNSICSGLPASKATAARVFILGHLQGIAKSDDRNVLTITGHVHLVFIK